MVLDARQTTSVTEADLGALMAGHVAEQKVVEYKSELPRLTPADKKEFLADVSSFANASGGHLLYGVTEREGIPTAIPGVDLGDPDKETLRWDAIIRDGISPRLGGVELYPVPLRSGRHVLLIRIPQSWGRPHMVTFDNTSRFYSRTSAGKYQLDVQEIRASFLISEAATDRIRDFRLMRLSQIAGGQTPVPLEDGAKIAMHIVPLESGELGHTVDLHAAAQLPLLLPIGGYASDRRFNFDGVLAYSKDSQGVASGYVQLFRNGSIEAVDTYFLKERNGDLGIPSQGFEQHLIFALQNYLAVLNSLAVRPPMFLMVTLLKVRGYRMIKSGLPPFTERRIDKDELLMPEALVELPANTHELLRPIFDAVWNACGYEGSPNFSESGRWAPVRG